MLAVTSILSIQSFGAYGHVGNSAATFPLMRLGVEVWPVPTVVFSNHTGYGQWRGPVLAAADVREVVRGIDEREVLGRCDAVLSGYQGSEDTGAAILDAVALVRQRNPAAIYCCDPVMGDVDRGVYVRPGIPDLMRERVVPAAQVITPNQFELGLLTGRPTATLAQVLSAAAAARELGPEVVLVTSVLHDRTAAGSIAMVAVTGEGAWSVTTPLLPRGFTGVGDLTAAVFLAGLLERPALDAAAVTSALARTAAIVFGVLQVTAASGLAELQLVAAQGEIAAPRLAAEVDRLD